MSRRAPFTTAFCGLVVLMSVLATMFPEPLAVLLYQTATPNPLALIGHIFFNDLLGGIFSALALWSVGQVIETETGTAKAAIFALIIAFLSCIAIQLAAATLGNPGILGGAWIVAGASWLAWSIRYPNMKVRFMFVAEIEGKWLGLVGVVLAILAFRPAQLSPFAALPLAFAWAYAANKLPFMPYGRPVRAVSTPTGPRGIKPPRPDYFDDVKRREQERAERERLRKLLESSVNDEPKDDR